MTTGFKSIKTRLMVWFLVAALVPLILVCLIINWQRVDAIKADAFNKLAVIRDLKAGEIQSWLDERAGDTRAFTRIAESENIAGVLTGNLKTTDAAKILKNLSNVLNQIRECYSDYAELYIICSQSGNIMVSTDPAREGMDVSGSDALIVPLKTGEVYISDIHESRSLGLRTMEMSFPIHLYGHQEDSPCGVLVTRIDLERSIYPLLLNRTGLGKTGETLIVNRDVVALNELRWYSKAPLKLKIEAEPAVLASQGKTGIVETMDYRGEKVLAAYTHFPKMGWGFVAKIDLKEIYAPIRALFISILILFSVVAVGVVLLSYFLARYTAEPILSIAHVASRIRKGDMSARNAVSSKDEIGFLAESFNRAAESVAFRIEMEKKNTDIAEALIHPRELKAFAEKVLDKFMEITGSQLGSFYLCRDRHDQFDPIAGVGVTSELLETFDAAAFEGQFGKSLKTAKFSHIKTISEETVFTFKTFAGTAIPKEMITLPVVVNNEVRAMICLASLAGYSQSDLTVLNQPAMILLNTAFANLLSTEETRRLAGELQQSNEELLEQQKELEAQAEELRKQSGELNEQNVALDQQRLALEEAGRLKSQFLSNMSHELRTPLNSVMALSRVLMMQAAEKLSPEEVGYLEIIERNGKNLLTLINEILDLSKIEAGRMDINLKAFQLGSTLENIIESITPIAREKKTRIHKEIPGDLPLIESDEIRVSQILQNLIGNAVKFTEEGQVTVSVRSNGETITVRIADTGIGISEKDLPYIFDEFRQVDGASSRKYEGTGLGLAIAHKAAGMLGGNIAVTSVPDKGSVFTLILPLAWQGNASVTHPIITRQPTEMIRQTVPSRILIVDDNEAVIIQVKAVLKSAGYTVDVARGGQEAYDYVSHTIPDGIILDLMMPEIDGFAVLEKIRGTKDTVKIPVLILTAKDLTPGDFERLSANHIQQFVQKGDIDRHSLLARIHSMVKG